MSDIDTVLVDSLKALDSKRPIQKRTFAQATLRLGRHDLSRARHLHSLQATDANVSAFGDDAVAEGAASASRVFDPEAARQTRHHRQCADFVLWGVTKTW